MEKDDAVPDADLFFFFLQGNNVNWAVFAHLKVITIVVVCVPSTSLKKKRVIVMKDASFRLNPLYFFAIQINLSYNCCLF